MSNKSNMVSCEFWVLKLTFEVLDLLGKVIHMILDPSPQLLAICEQFLFLGGHLLVLKQKLLIQLGPGVVAVL